MTNLIKVRCSSADRVMGCHASSAEPELKLDSSGPWSNFGNAGHQVMAEIVKEDLVTMPDISKVVDEYRIEDEKALRIGLHIGLKEYKDVIRPSIDRNYLITETFHTRQIGPSHELTGHPDLACLLIDHETLYICDWKFGDVSDHWNQLKGYAYVLLQYHPDVKNVLLGQYFLRVNDKTVREFSREHIEVEWKDKFIEALNDDSYKPSFPNCKYCPRPACEARDGLDSATTTSLTTIGIGSRSIAVEMANKFEDVKLLEKHIDKYKQHLKDHLNLTEQDIELENGKVLTLIEGHRGTLYLYEALELLKGYFGSSDTDDLLQLLKGCVTIKKTALMDLIGRHATTGEKGREKKRVGDEMEMVGAIKIKSHQKLALKKGRNNEHTLFKIS